MHPSIWFALVLLSCIIAVPRQSMSQDWEYHFTNETRSGQRAFFVTDHVFVWTNGVRRDGDKVFFWSENNDPELLRKQNAIRPKPFPGTIYYDVTAYELDCRSVSYRMADYIAYDRSHGPLYSFNFLTVGDSWSRIIPGTIPNYYAMALCDSGSDQQKSGLLFF